VNNLKALAGDLDSFLRGVTPAPAKATPPSLEQSGQRVATPAALPAQAEQAKVPPQRLVRAVWDYVSSRIEEEDGARTIGETFMVAVAATARDADVNVDAMNSAAIDFLESIVEAARGVL
jgi:hypothetical protein